MVAAAWIGLAGLALPIAGEAARAPEIRVLVLESGDPFEVSSTRVSHRIGIASRAGEVEVDGRAVGARYFAAGEGPWRVDRHRYRGRIELIAAAGVVQVVNHVELEDYVAATVGGEMPASWPEQALFAQAVATRTYALHHRERRSRHAFDVRATEASQVYQGLDTESPATRRAADETRGEILTHRSRPILAAFHSTAGGRTASASEVWGEAVPYLGSVDVEHEEDAPFTYWRQPVERRALEALFESMGAGLGPLRSLEVDERTESGRVERLIAEGRDRRVFVRGDHLKSLVERLDLHSTLFDVRRTSEGFAFVGSGHGHGVGMSQWGARELARRGATYPRILARFYPGARLEAWRGERMAARGGPGKRGD